LADYPKELKRKSLKKIFALHVCSSYSRKPKGRSKQNVHQWMNKENVICTPWNTIHPLKKKEVLSFALGPIPKKRLVEWLKVKVLSSKLQYCN
jgi:hypothetical protein